ISPMVGRSMPRSFWAKTEPMTPYSSRWRGLGKTLAPTSMTTHRPRAVGMTVAMPGRWTHLRNLRVRRPPATTAPVLPALTSPLTFPAASSCQQRKIEASGFLRSASPGFSFMSTATGAWTSSTRPAGTGPAAASRGSVWAWSPTSTTVRSGLALTARTAPATLGPGPWSPPSVSSAIRIRLPASLAGLLLFLFHHDRVAALVEPAVGADPVGQHRLVAPGAELDLHRGDVVVAAAGALPGAGG